MWDPPQASTISAMSYSIRTGPRSACASSLLPILAASSHGSVTVMLVLTCRNDVHFRVKAHNGLHAHSRCMLC